VRRQPAVTEDQAVLVLRHDHHSDGLLKLDRLDAPGQLHRPRVALDGQQAVVGVVAIDLDLVDLDVGELGLGDAGVTGLHVADADHRQLGFEAIGLLFEPRLFVLLPVVAAVDLLPHAFQFLGDLVRRPGRPLNGERLGGAEHPGGAHGGDGVGDGLDALLGLALGLGLLRGGAHRKTSCVKERTRRRAGFVVWFTDGELCQTAVARGLARAVNTSQGCFTGERE
jgi:hypothetical protein